MHPRLQKRKESVFIVFDFEPRPVFSFFGVQRRVPPPMRDTVSIFSAYEVMQYDKLEFLSFPGSKRLSTGSPGITNAPLQEVFGVFSFNAREWPEKDWRCPLWSGIVPPRSLRP